MKRSYLMYLVYTLTAVLSLSACGFHLRGSMNIPKWFNNISIINPASDKELLAKLKLQLQRYHICISPNPASAKYWLIINNPQFHQQIISIGASTNPRQYQLIMRVTFLLKDNHGRIIIPEKQISISRQLTINSDRILGSNAEETTFITEMKQDAAIQILNLITHST